MSTLVFNLGVRIVSASWLGLFLEDNFKNVMYLPRLPLFGGIIVAFNLAKIVYVYSISVHYVSKLCAVGIKVTVYSVVLTCYASGH